MKSKISLVAGAIALSLVAIPFAVKAQTHTHAPLLLAQEQKGPMHGPMERLGLTDAQKSQIQEIHRKTRADMEKILTPEQQQKLKTAMQNSQGRQNRESWRNTMSSLNLTDDQKNQLKSLMQTERTQMEGVLTAEQKQQLQQFKENMRARRQQRNSTSTPTP